MRPFALLEPGRRRLTVTMNDGTSVASGRRAVESNLAALKEAGVTCYVPAGLSALRHTTGALSWTLTTWRGREVSMLHHPTGLRVTSLRGALEGLSDPFTALWTGLDWLHGYGVQPGSLSGMAWKLWRASLSRPVVISFDPRVGRRSLYGGRQEVPTDVGEKDGRPWRQYQQMVSVDMRAAYPHAMAARPFALGLREVDPSTRLDPETAGLAEATVIVDSDMPYAPLPTRLAPTVICFQWGTVHGVWPWGELAAARELGCEVKIKHSWAPRRMDDLFTAWWDLIRVGRELPHGADRLAKTIGNVLWGQFGMVGDDRAVVRWTDDSGNNAYPDPQPTRNLPHAYCAHVAAEITSRVRTRLQTEGLYGGQFRPVHIDTDGLLVRKRSRMPLPFGDDFGQWRVKETMARLQIKAPQLYRFTCGKGCGVTHAKWHYVASGLTPNQAVEFFRTQGRTRTTVSYLSAYDTVISPTHSDDTSRLQKLLLEANGMGR